MILGKVPPVGWYCCLFAIACLLCCVCSRAAMCTWWMILPCLSTKTLRYLHARMAARRVFGPFSAWFLYAAASISCASSSGCLVSSLSLAAFARGVPLSGTWCVEALAEASSYLKRCFLCLDLVFCGCFRFLFSKTNLCHDLTKAKKVTGKKIQATLRELQRFRRHLRESLLNRPLNSIFSSS